MFSSFLLRFDRWCGEAFVSWVGVHVFMVPTDCVTAADMATV